MQSGVIKMSLNIEKNKELTTVYLSGEIDHHSAKFIRNEIDSVVTSLAPRELALDFSAVTFMDSSGIGLVMGRYKLINSLGGKLYVKNVSPGTEKIMKLAGLDLLAKISSKEM